MTINIDIYPVSGETEATELMVHHLGLAAMYFEATHDDRGLFANKLIKEKLGDGHMEAASSFVDVLCSYHEKLDTE